MLAMLVRVFAGCELSLFCCVTADKCWVVVEVGPAERVFRVSLQQRFPEPVQTCKECGLTSFETSPERGILSAVETLYTLTTFFLNCTNVRLWATFLAQSHDCVFRYKCFQTSNPV